MCILETPLERFLEIFSQIGLCRKALTLSYKGKLRNNNKFFLQKYALLTLSLDIIFDIIYYLHDIALKSAMSK